MVQSKNEICYTHALSYPSQSDALTISPSCPLHVDACCMSYRVILDCDMGKMVSLSAMVIYKLASLAQYAELYFVCE